MIDVICFLAFLVYTIVVFFIKNYYIIFCVAIFNIILMITLKVKIRNALINILKLLPFIIFTSGINMIISGINYGALIGVRLILVCNMTYIFAKNMTPQKMQYVIEKLLKPLKLFKIDSREIGIIVCIGIAFIPILQKEIADLKYALKAKGFNPNFRNFIKNPNYILTPLITSIIKRVGEIEMSLLSKGYVS